VDALLRDCQDGAEFDASAWRSRVASDLFSSEADFDKIKTVRATAMPWEAAT
jgi:hypothetical protein